MTEFGPRISRGALARMTGATALGLAVAPQVASAGSATHRHLHRSSVLTDGRAGDVGMDADALEDAFARVARRATDGRYPGAVALVARRGVVVGERAFGVRLAGSTRGHDDRHALRPRVDDEGARDLDGRDAARPARQALADRSGRQVPARTSRRTARATCSCATSCATPPGLPVDNQKVDTDDIDAIWRFMEETPLEYPTGTMVEYSDLGYRLLGRLIETVAKTDLDTFAKREIWGPLGMSDTTYNPAASLVPRCAATGPGSLGLRPGPLRGSVQDDQDWKVGGIVGCDGAFATARDVAIFSQMILNGGSYGDVRLLSKKLVAAMVANQTPQVTEAATDQDPTTNLLFTPKGYGFELWTHRFSPGGMRLSPGSYGKSGGAGTFMWIDPKRELIAILLTNHGLPVPFDQPGWNLLIDSVAVAEFVDGVVNAVRE